jgi:hypothetical protein
MGTQNSLLSICKQSAKNLRSFLGVCWAAIIGTPVPVGNQIRTLENEVKSSGLGGHRPQHTRCRGKNFPLVAGCRKCLNFFGEKVRTSDNWLVVRGRKEGGSR